jgi:hypothetical protein
MCSIVTAFFILISSRLILMEIPEEKTEFEIEIETEKTNSIFTQNYSTFHIESLKLNRKLSLSLTHSIFFFMHNEEYIIYIFTVNVQARLQMKQLHMKYPLNILLKRSRRRVIERERER